jgi:hypothetical protein
VEEDGLQLPVTAPEVTVRLAGQFAVRPVEGETTVVRVTVPVKVPIGVTVIVELPVAPVLKSAGDAAETEKSAPTTKLNVADAGWDAVPGEPAPVMVTEKALAVVEVQDNTEVPVPFAVSDTGVTVNALHVRPVGRGVSERATEPTKLNVLVRVTVELIDEPVAPLGEVALIVKSPTWTVEAAECDAVPGEPAPVIVTPYVAAVVELRVQEALTVAFAVMLTGAGQVTVKPVTGLVTAVRLIVPAKLNVLVRLTDIAAPVAPEFMLTGVPAEMVKSPTCEMKLVEWVLPPPVPVIVTR